MNEKSTSIQEPTKPIRVQLDGLNDPATGRPLWLPAKTTGDRWNGFATPWFDKETADRIVDAFRSHSDARGGQGIHGRYSPEPDAFVFVDHVSAGEEVFAGRKFRSGTLYPIGAWSWAWSAAGDFDEQVQPA